MPREAKKLTTEKAGNGIRYRKRFKGKTWTSTVFPVDSRRNKDDAWVAFIAWRDKFAEAKTPQQVVADDFGHLFDRAADWWRLAGQPSLAAQSREAAALIRQTAGFDPQTFATVAGILTETFTSNPDRWSERLAVVEAQRAAEHSDTVAGNIEEFLKVKRAEVRDGQLSAGRADFLRTALFRFRDWFGGTRPIAAIDSAALVEFKAHLSGLELAPIYRRDTLNAVKQLVRWLWSLERIETLPRVMGDKNQTLTLRVVPKKVKTIPVETIRSIFDAASPRTKLYILLALNCGMTQVDIADLLREEVDLKAHRIRRQRSKTRELHEDVPEVSYKLWPVTAKLLVEHLAADGPLALLNEDGGPLKVEELTGDRGDELRKVCNISAAWNRVRTKLKARGIDVPPFKRLRKTGASILVSDSAYAPFESYYLGECEGTTAGKFYIDRSGPLFDKGVEWMGRQLGFVK